MRVEVLHFDGCPTYRATEKTLREVLVREDVEADVELVAGKRMDVEEVFFLRVEEGKFVDFSGLEDSLNRRQLGLLPSRSNRR